MTRTTCPWCLKRDTVYDDPRLPGVGGLYVCRSCAEISVFTAHLRRATNSELERLPPHAKAALVERRWLTREAAMRRRLGDEETT